MLRLVVLPGAVSAVPLTRVERHVEQFGKRRVVGEAQVVLQASVDEALSGVVMGGAPMSDGAIDGVLKCTSINHKNGVR